MTAPFEEGAIETDSFDSPDAYTESFLGNIDIPASETTETTTESPFADATTSIGDGTCRVCGAPTFRPPGLTPTGRKKRVPAYCDLHTPNSRLSNDGPDFTGVESQLQRIQGELADDFKLLAMLTGPMFPVLGFFVFEHADPFTIAILKLTKNNPTAIKLLYRVAQVAPIYEVAETVAGGVVAFNVDQKRMDPHSMIAQRLGVERAYNSVYPETQTNVATNVPSNGFGPPPRYATTN